MSFQAESSAIFRRLLGPAASISLARSVQSEHHVAALCDLLPIPYRSRPREAGLGTIKRGGAREPSRSVKSIDAGSSV
jgi:hypothetical protein